MTKNMRVKEVAEQLGVSPSGVRKYVNEGRLNCKLTPGGQRYFTQDDVDAFTGVEKAEITVFYVRSSSGSTTALNKQIEQLSAIASPIKIYKERASGLNEQRPQLSRLLAAAEKREFNTVYVTEKDRFTRFGYTYLEKLLAKDGITVKALKEVDKKDLHEELMRDFMNLIASFSGRFYRLRGKEQKIKLLDTARSEVTDD
jgi:putative resolvase